jgi:putative transposase
VKFAFIDEKKAEPDMNVKAMCRVLGVSRSGYYASRHREESKHARDDRRLSVLCREVHERSKRRYGSARVYDELHKAKVPVSRKRVVRLMREQGIYVRPRRKWKKTIDAGHALPVADNVLNRAFNVDAPNQKWGGDVTELWTPDGRMFLAVVVDLYSRFVVGWALSAVNDRHLAMRALQMAQQRRRPARGLLHHTDRGSPYASEDYQAILNDNGFVCSMSRKGNCYDNAVVESFFKTLKAELGERFESPAALKRDAFEYIEVFYNQKRIHSALGKKSPAEYERAERLKAAA